MRHKMVTSATMTPADIEQTRKWLSSGGALKSDTSQALCELALDGLKFRAWANGASSKPSVVAVALAPCSTLHDFRLAIERLLADGKISP